MKRAMRTVFRRLVLFIGSLLGFVQLRNMVNVPRPVSLEAAGYDLGWLFFMALALWAIAYGLGLSARKTKS